ncbi:MAG: DinB family protein [Planctomycetota bacterium]|nr:MAG: DinB family protein [Planctomycetota bacterium]
MNAPAFHAAGLIDRLERGAAAVRATALVCSPDDARWKPDEDSWSVLEIVCHLVDEEAEDFPLRLRSLLEAPAREWAPIDPSGWAVQRNYLEQDFAERVDRFVAARAASVAWLRSLPAPDWGAAKTHATLGPMRAGDLLGAWAAHDALHLRQIAKRLHQLAYRDARPFEIGYAGTW